MSSSHLEQNHIDQDEFIQKAGKIGTFEWDLVKGISTWSKGFEALYGFPNGGFKGKNSVEWSKLLHPEDKKKVADATAYGLKHENELNIEFRVIWPDKSVHHLMTRAKIVRNAKKKAIRVIGVNIDITERKQVESNLSYLAQVSKVLSSSLDYNKTLKAVADLGVPEIADWCAVDMLTADNQIHRLAVAHIDPKKVKWAIELNKKDPPDINDETNGLTKVLTKGETQFYPVITDEMLVASARDEEHLKLARKLQLSSVMMLPIIIQDKPVGAISFIYSESGRKYTQADLTVAQEVAARAALAIHNARLFTESQKAVSVRDEFISVASHELKTPVTSLKMYTQVILEQMKRKGEDQMIIPLKKMETQINKLTLLIDDLLNISKLQLGKLEFHEEFFDLQEVVVDTIESVQASSIQHKITIKGTLTKKVWGDKYRIAQVITNLLTNAIKYSPEAHKVVVHVGETKHNAEITVQDYGIGITKEQQKKIFTRFYRVSGPEARTFPGLGIGLYISSEIVRRHHGKIDVKSIKGKGSKFCFTMPFTKQTHE
ncbi:MAG: ATP-binding protein [Patescibacteria group bacterium]